MKISAEFLEKTWVEIAAKLSSASEHLFLEKSLLQGPIGLSAVIQVKDSMPGIILRVPNSAPNMHWVVRHFSGVRFEGALKMGDEIGFPIMLADIEARHIYAVLAADLASLISGTGTSEVRMTNLAGRIALWRRFFQSRVGNLTEAEVRGLIGELWMWNSIRTVMGTDFAIESWRGPYGELHDFLLRGFRIEVKSWINESLPRIFISDPSQLVVDEISPVWIAAVELSRDPASGRKLRDWVELILATLNDAQKDLFTNLLADIGFLSAHSELYPEAYTVREVVYYKVCGDFPRIDAALIPAGVTTVKYAIDISAITQFAQLSPLGKL